MLPSPLDGTHVSLNLTAQKDWDILVRSKDSEVVRAVASHLCHLGLKPGPGIISGPSLLLVLALLQRFFCFPPSIETKCLNTSKFHSIWKQRVKSLPVGCATDCKFLLVLFYLFHELCPLNLARGKDLLTSTYNYFSKLNKIAELTLRFPL